MIQWKQRLYAFLLRRILGPILTQESLRKLHACIDVSLQEGSFELRDVGLNAAYLSQKLEQHGLRVRNAQVRKLEIHLALQEHDEDADSSLAWRALQLGTSNSTEAGGSSSVSLLATIEIDGVRIQIEPCPKRPEKTSPQHPQVDEDASPTTKSVLSSYIEAALASLRLAVTLKNLHIRVFSGQDQKWLEFRMHSAYYHDVKVASTAVETSDNSNYETVMHKAIELTRITILTGDLVLGNGIDSPEGLKDVNVSTVALLEGTSTVRVRVVEYRKNMKNDSGDSAVHNIQQDIEIGMNQKLNMSVDAVSLRQIRSVAQSFLQREIIDDNEETEGTTNATVELAFGDEMLDDSEDLSAIDGILKQYQEARFLAERKVVRGGILVPSFETDGDSTGKVTFDTFFDANDHGFSKYSSALKESIMCDTQGGLSVDWVHTKLRFRLQEGGMKLTFLQDTARRRPREYVLLTFTEVNLSSSFSIRSSEHSFSIIHLELEDSLLVGSDKGPVAIDDVAIGSLLRFSPDTDGDDGASDDCDLLVEAPCISLHVKTDRKDETDTTEVEFTLEPLEISYRPATIAKLGRLFENSNDDSSISASDGSSKVAEEIRKKSLVNFSCASVAVLLPLSEEKDWSPLYERCGYVTDSSPTTKSSLGIIFDHVFLKAHDERLRSKQNASITFRNILVYASSPIGANPFDRSIRRIDIMAFAGRTEVNPCIPISVELASCISKVSAGGDWDENPATRSFPKVAHISSFKARQEDEDEDDRIDRVLSSKLTNLHVDSRKELRGIDPQSDMLDDVMQSDVAVSISIPEFVGDLTADELSILNQMLGCAFRGPRQQPTDKEQTEKMDKTRETKRIAISVTCDYVSLTIHGEMATPEEGEDSISFMTRMEQFTFHALTDALSLRHTRILSQDVNFFEVSNLGRRIPGQNPSCLDMRLDILHERGTCQGDSIASPIFYRSHLFSPISRKNPVFLFDAVNLSRGKTAVSHKNIYFTLYDTTYRHMLDSNWPERLGDLVSSMSRNSAKEHDHTVEDCVPTHLTRVFLSFADCNIDYSTPTRFKTASRLIARIGDMHMSSNLLKPHPPVQAYSISLGDVSLYLCNSRYPYNFENSCLLRSATVLQPGDLSLSHLALPPDVEPDAVLRAMNYRTIVTLDSADAVIGMSNTLDKPASDPFICANSTIGQLALFSCKDSFSLFTRTIGEASAEITSIDDDSLEVLRSKSTKIAETDLFYHSRTEDVGDAEEEGDMPFSPENALDDLKKQSALRPAAGTASQEAAHFLLDGYDWTTIDSEECSKPSIPPGEEQAARWYGSIEKVSISATSDDNSNAVKDSADSVNKEDPADQKLAPRIISHHFPLHPVSDPIVDGDMGIAKYAGSHATPQIHARILVHDLTMNLRFFDGYDWPESLDKQERSATQGGAFVIPEVSTNSTNPDEKTEISNIPDANTDQPEKRDKAAKLMDDLLSGGLERSCTFQNIPLPEERARSLREQAELRRLVRRTSKFFHIAASGVSLRVDSVEESSEHRLSSCMNLKAQDFFLAETISSNRPVKMVGEWLNEEEHPRDSKDGLISMKMVTWHPSCRVTPENEITNDESEAVLKILPLRCLIDQRAIAFARAFFRSGDSEESSEYDLRQGLHAVPPPLFTMFRVRPFKLKVDYKPRKLDSKALRDGAVVELINLSPLDGMVLTLRRVEIENEVGFGSVMSVFLRRLVQDICQTQLHKFVTNARPLEPITQVSGAAVDLVVLPWEAFRNGETIQRAFRSGATSFSKTLVYEFCTLTSRATEFIADSVSRASVTRDDVSGGGGELLPSRPLTTPRGVTDAAPHAVESISRGFQAANYKIIIVPYREYCRTGASSAAKSVLKGIPVAIAAPASGAAEALSFALLGVRNQIRPDIRKEEEASVRGLLLDKYNS